MEGSDARRAAFEILRRVEREGAYSSLLLQNLGEDRPVDPRDLALTTELVYGVLRRRLYLDHVLGSFSSRPVPQIDNDLAIILRLALYQLLYLDRIPAHAAVNTAVNLARSHMKGKGASAASFVNGLLRAVTRVPADALPQVNTGDPIGNLAITESHPEWLVRRWADRSGRSQTAALLAAHNRPAPLALRVNRGRVEPAVLAARLAQEGVVTRPSSLMDDFLLVHDGRPQHTACFRNGDFYIQDEASGLVARMAGATPGMRVLDACAAPGGKSLSVARAVGEAGMVIAADRHPQRLRLLTDNAHRLGISTCLPVAADLATSAPPFHPGVLFDIVMVDAPCTGTGVIRRNPELRYRVDEEVIRTLSRLQQQLLAQCAQRVRPGGMLLYSVCSIEPEEGSDQAVRFLREHPGFEPSDPSDDLPAAARELVVRLDAGACLITLPHRDDLDGFFAARFIRRV